MRPRIAFLAMAAVATALPQTTPPAMLDTGLPNLFPTPPPLTTGASSTNPLLIPRPSGGLAPSGSGPCQGSPVVPCILTAQYNNARTNTSLLEDVFTTSNVATGSFGAHKRQFLVDKSGVPAGNYNPIYAQPLYVSNVTIQGSTYNVLYVVTLNGEVYAFNADYNASSTATCGNGAGQSGCLWKRDETNATTAMQGFKHNCDQPGVGNGSSVVTSQQQLLFTGVISTPVIDYVNGILYVVNLCQQPSGANPDHWWLNALNIYNGANVASAADIAYTAQQVQNNPYGPHQALSQLALLQRASLLLTAGYASGCQTNCTVYESVVVAFGNGTTENTSQYQGWVFAYDANPSDATYLTPNYNLNSSGKSANALPYITQCEFPPENTTPPSTPACGKYTLDQHNNPIPNAWVQNSCGQGGGVWMSARAPSANSTGQVFYDAANGGFNYCPNCTNKCAGNNGQLVENFTNFGEAVLQTDMTKVWAATPTTSNNVQAPFWPTNYFVPAVVPAGVTSATNDCGPPYGSTGPCTYLQVLNQNDWDFGVSGTLLFDDDWYDSANTYHCANQICTDVSMLLTTDKRGDGYALLQGNLGQYTGTDQGAVARFNISSGAMNGGTNTNCTAIGGNCDEPRTPAYWQPGTEKGFLVIWPWNEPLASFQWKQLQAGSQFTFTSVGTANNPFGSAATGYAGGALMMTANPSESPAAAVVWAAAEPYPNPAGSTACNQVAGVFCLGYLLAYKLDGTSGALSANQIWPSSLPTVPDFAVTPFAIPTAAHGNVYVPTFGLCSQFNGSTCVARNTYTNAGVQVYSF